MTNFLESIVEIEPPRPLKVANVVGTPSTVASQVNRYIKQGYQLGSTLMPWVEPNSNVNLFVQQVVLYEDQEDVEYASPRCEN